jgi:hypothetical protein
MNETKQLERLAQRVHEAALAEVGLDRNLRTEAERGAAEQVKVTLDVVGRPQAKPRVKKFAVQAALAELQAVLDERLEPRS